MKSYFVYVHGSKEDAAEQARAAGLTEEEIEDYGLAYIGYEVKLKITLNDDNTYSQELALD